MRSRTGALEFIHHEAAGSIFLVSAAALALILANSPWAGPYDALLATHVGFKAGGIGLDKSLLHWINDGLMAVFFFLVGLEIKRELVQGELSTWRRAALPAIAALGGMIVPALIYVAINAGNPETMPGWAIPCATDIAFAVGVMALVGARVPPALKIFLLALAIIDDLGAIVVIALFYTSELSTLALAFAAVGLLILFLINRSGSVRAAPYILAGLYIWVCVMESGVHATLAGVATALAVPLSGDEEAGGTTLCQRLQDRLHPWVTFAILPLFAFANAGVSLAGVTPDRLADPVPLGIALGLLLGKPTGVMLFSWLAITLGLGARPEGTRWIELLGAGILAGIGFTMSLFIGMLAFDDPARAIDIRLGVLGGSLASAIIGYAVLSRASAAGLRTPR